jgi:hypothetical protein
VVNSSNPQINYTITIWYPYVGHNNKPSWANCIYTTSGDLRQYYAAHCISINATAFVATQPSPPPL